MSLANSDNRQQNVDSTILASFAPSQLAAHQVSNPMNQVAIGLPMHMHQQQQQQQQQPCQLAGTLVASQPQCLGDVLLPATCAHHAQHQPIYAGQQRYHSLQAYHHNHNHQPLSYNNDNNLISHDQLNATNLSPATIPRQKQPYSVNSIRQQLIGQLRADQLNNNNIYNSNSNSNNIAANQSIGLQIQRHNNFKNQQFSAAAAHHHATNLNQMPTTTLSNQIDKSSLLPVQFVHSNISPTSSQDSKCGSQQGQELNYGLQSTTTTCLNVSATRNLHNICSSSSLNQNQSDSTSFAADSCTSPRLQQKQDTLVVESGKFKTYLTQLVLASNVPFAYAIILVAFLITIIAATSIITILTIVLTLTGYTAYPITENTFNTSLAIGVVCASFALALVTASLIVWRRHCQAAYYYLDEPQDASRGTNSPQLSETYDDSEYGSISVNDWAKHVQKLHADSDIGFTREFEQIANQKNSALTCEHSNLIENKPKNRYTNIVAYDHTRVILRPPLGGQKKPGFDYINANFIDVSVFSCQKKIQDLPHIE